MNKQMDKQIDGVAGGKNTLLISRYSVCGHVTITI